MFLTYFKKLLIFPGYFAQRNSCKIIDHNPLQIRPLRCRGYLIIVHTFDLTAIRPKIILTVNKNFVLHDLPKSMFFWKTICSLYFKKNILALFFTIKLNFFTEPFVVRRPWLEGLLLHRPHRLRHLRVHHAKLASLLQRISGLEYLHTLLFTENQKIKAEFIEISKNKQCQKAVYTYLLVCTCILYLFSINIFSINLLPIYGWNHKAVHIILVVQNK